MTAQAHQIAEAERANREVYRQVAQRSGGTVVDASGVTMVIGVHSSPVIANAAFRTDPSACSGREVLDLVTGTFRERGRSASIITNPLVDGDIESAAAGTGWACVIELTAMVCLQRPLQTTTPSDGVELVEVSSPSQHAELRDAMMVGFGDGDRDIEAMIGAVFADFASVAPPGVTAVVARSEGRPAAAGVMYVHDQTGVPGFIATVPAARRRGLGALITDWLTSRAFDVGCTFACLESSPEGRSVYRDVGYEEVGIHRVWLSSSA